MTHAQVISAFFAERTCQDSIDCRIHVSQRDFRTLQEIEQSFLAKVEKLLHDVQQHQAFARTPGAFYGHSFAFV